MSNIINIGGGAGGSSGGGHTILDNSGTSLTQRSELQFKGAYSEDNSTDQITEVSVLRSMTKAQFDLLSESEKQGIINVTDVTGGGENEFQPVIYSETEREIGVWTDGKPLYEKTVILSSTIRLEAGSWTTVSDVPATTEDECVGCYIYLGADKSMNSAFGKFDSGYLKIYNPVALLVDVITIQYTKSTDTAGSGQWTPQGVPAVHYSTDEHIVGTWIDGSTLYEKTVATNSFNLSSGNEVEILEDTTIDLITSAYGSIIENSIIYAVAEANVRFVKSTGKLYFKCMSGSWSNANAYVTVRYTKSST